ncbi:MAG: D-TA family PLP-dependent enzyme [Cytophagales bacterium]|nr:D-TA family PLP-dependent enzyme [Cytophagales bacterium]
MAEWFEFEKHEEIMSPAMIVYPERIQRNIDRMIEIAGNPDRLRPHVKTHKCPDIIRLQLQKAIYKHKCATLSEAFMLGTVGAKDVLIAYPLIGPAIDQFHTLKSYFPETKYSILVDHVDQLQPWMALEREFDVFIDLNVGMDRTGCDPREAPEILTLINDSLLNFRGWHAYDGQIHDHELKSRKRSVEKAFQPVLDLVNQTDTQAKELICGGSITLPIHAVHKNRQLSPGTTLLWDIGYGRNFPDLPFEIAAQLMARVVSLPDDNKICIDLGYKAIASEMKVPVAKFPQIPDAVIEMHSEEHMVISTSEAQKWNIGDVVFAMPYHICPSMALHDKAMAVEKGRYKEFWPIPARDRFYLVF